MTVSLKVRDAGDCLAGFDSGLPGLLPTEELSSRSPAASASGCGRFPAQRPP